MSQLQFQVSIVGANQRTKATIPPPSNFSFTADTSSSSSPSPSSLSSHFQLPCSPIAPARVILKNTENYSVYYKVYTDRPSSTSSSGGGGDHHSSEKNVFIHPVRGAVKPHKSVTIAVVLAPPPDPTAATRTPRDSSSAMSPEQQERKKQQQRSQTPKKVSFAGDKDSDHDHDHDQNNNDDSLDLSNHAGGPYCTNRKPILRMKIEAVIILSEGSSSKRLEEQQQHDEQFFVNNHEHEEEDQSADEIQLHQQRASQHQRQSKISREDFENRWKQGVQMPSRIFDIVSVKPSVSRDDYLHYLVSRKIHRCDRLVKRCEGLENQCDRLLRRVEDLKEADVIERTKELEMNKARNAASINVVALVVGVIASFAAGFTL